MGLGETLPTSWMDFYWMDDIVFGGCEMTHYIIPSLRN